MICLLDANIPMYAAGRDHPYREPCRQIIHLAARGIIPVATDAEVLQEILHRYLALGRAADAMAITRDFIRIVAHVLPVTVEDITRTLRVLEQYPNLRARDALHVAVMLNATIPHIITADQHFDAVSEVTRLDPLELEQWLPSVSA